jgi:hypothetical protein
MFWSLGLGWLALWTRAWVVVDRHNMGMLLAAMLWRCMIVEVQLSADAVQVLWLPTTQVILRTFCVLIAMHTHMACNIKPSWHEFLSHVLR